MTDRPLQVLIIGASLEGACLAHGLKRIGLGVAVYERERSMPAPPFGSRVSIGPDGNRALSEALPPDLYQTFIAMCAAPPRQLTVYSENLDELFSARLPATGPQGPDARLRSASAAALRRLLLTGIEDIVQFGKEFIRYERRPDGKIAAFFADGTSAVGGVLVGADGWQSRVRRQYLPDAEARDYGMVAITGQVPLHEAAGLLPHQEMLSGISVVYGRHGLQLVAQSMEFVWDREGRLKDDVSGMSAALITTWPGAPHELTRDHLMWGLMTTASPRHAGQPAGLADAVAGVTRRWHPALRALIERTEPSAVAARRALVWHPAGPWPATEVTLLGGAGQVRIPDPGAGATQALRGAGLLCRLLAEAVTERRPVAAAIRDYETQILRPGLAGGRAYSQCLNRKARMKATVTGPLLSAAAMTRLRVANRVPALKRRVAGEFSWLSGMPN
jgi:2-polyprenyl-6-methoxyphenol hydroxylase-like FAD-dependent oxidoreductase